MGRNQFWDGGWRAEYEPILEVTWGPEWRVEREVEYPPPNRSLSLEVDWGVEYEVEYGVEYGVEWGIEWGVEWEV